MKFTNWKEAFKNDPNADTFRKNAKTVINFLHEPEDDIECIQNLVDKPNLISISIAPITNDIQVFHHMTKIGGVLSNPTESLVALKGFSSSASPVQFDFELFDSRASIDCPSWESLKAVKDAAEISALEAPTPAVEKNLRQVMLLPPLFSRTFIEPASFKAADLLIECLSAMNAFDLSLEEDSDIPKATVSCKDIIYFLWAASKKDIDPTITVEPEDCHIKAFCEDLHDKHILASTLSAPNSDEVVPPSNSTFSSLAGSISGLTTHLEKESSDRKSTADDKRNKFEKLPSSSQQLILFASSSKEDTIAKSNITDDFSNFLKQSSISRARTHLNQVLKSLKCQFDAPALLVSSLLAGDLIWISSSQLPAKLTIFLAGRPNLAKASMSSKDWLKLQLQESSDNSLDDKMIEKLADFKFDHPSNHFELRHYMNNFLGICYFLLSKESEAAQSLLTWVHHLDDFELLYENNFSSDPLFGLKICLTIDRSLQLFLQSCQEARSFNDVKFSYLDFKFDQESIERGRFTCNPPAPLLALFSNSNGKGINGAGGSSSKRRHNALSSSHQTEDAAPESIQNTSFKREWQLGSNELYRKVFPPSIWQNNPPPKMNNSDKLSCPRWFSKGYCFGHCRRSHDIMDADTVRKFNDFQQTCLRSAR